MSRPLPPPETPAGILRQLGPGLIISANVVGSGELLVTTSLGSKAGFTLLWFIVLGCLVKVFLQVELGRHAILRGITTLDILNRVPGRILGLSWVVWLWVAMFVATFFQLAGMVGTVAEVFREGGAALPEAVWAVLITGSCALLLWFGRYLFIERLATVLVAGFTLFTLATVASLYWTPYGITLSQLGQGMSLGLPSDFRLAFAAFGVIGMGASELIYYPYWCLEKGYARHVGPDDGSAEWRRRARGWIRVLRWDAWVSMVLYTVATVAFYLLGAAVLHSQGMAVEKDDMVPNLSRLYGTSFGAAGLAAFLAGATVVLYSTIFISTASNARLSVDFLALLGRIRGGSGRRSIQIACLVLPVLYLAFYLLVREPLPLVMAGAVAQALMLPFLACAALLFHFRSRGSGVGPGPGWMALVWISCALMALIGLYQLWQEVAKIL